MPFSRTRQPLEVNLNMLFVHLPPPPPLYRALLWIHLAPSILFSSESWKAYQYSVTVLPRFCCSASFSKLVLALYISIRHSHVS